MIPQINEINFPEYATLSTATASLVDMGDRTISAQVKIDGDIVPDFSYDWEVEFKGERYIQPLRQPQASKGNESIYSLIDLTFYHKTIYDLKRYFFVEMASTIAGTAIADKYIASLTVNLKDFCANFQNVLDYYFEGEITINLNPDWVYAEEPSFVEINYSHIWDVLLKIHEVYGVRWHLDGNTIFIGYPTEEVAHTFEYGFEGGLLKVERQVQSADICNSLLGRGGEKNLPYRYFKDASKDAQGNEWKADPDWIPELASVNFTNLRGKTFRDYIKGWKAQRYGGTPMSEPTEEYNRGYADSAKSEDGKYFNPIEYVEDKDSIEKYGLLQNGLDNVEDIFPTIQDVEVDGIGRVDEIVGAEQVIIDEATSDYTPKSVTMSIDDTFTSDQIEATDVENEYILRSNTIHQFNEGSVGYIMSNPSFKTTFSIAYFDLQTLQFKTESGELDTDLLYYKVFDVDNNSYLKDIVSIPSGIRFKVEYKVRIKPHSLGSASVTSSDIFITSNWSMSSRPFAGEILENLNTDGTRKSVTIAVPSKETKSVTIQSDTFTIPEDGATNIDVPVSINTDLEGEGLYEWKRDIEAVNTETNEVVTSINIPQGTYYLRVKVEITNNSDSAYDYKVELLPSYILYPTDSEEFKPTFDIWVKNIWNTSRNAGESDQAYADRVWLPILGDRDGNEPKVVFTTGRLAGHSDWEFKIHNFAYAGGDGVEYNGVKAEWRLTLVKSEAEIEATGKWIPSTMQQAFVGDHFFFIGIDMPHEYILWAEERLDDYKRDKILDTANIKPTWVVQTDKVRLNQDKNGATLLDSFKVGNSILIADTRFIEGEYERLYLQSITYSWDAQTILYPNVEVVLADKPITTSNPVAKIQGDIESLNRSAVKTSDVQNLILTIGDKIYLRKDGLPQVSNSPTTFNQPINSAGYRQGAFGGRGWGLRNDGEKGILEVDKLVVRDDLQVNTIVSNQIEAIGGKQIESAARITCTKVEDIDSGYKCYFDQKQGSVVNLFKVNDIALSQVFSPDNSEVKYYKRVVEAVDNNSITLSKTQVDGDGMPQEGDVIVHFGNTTDPNRQYVIIRDVIGGGYERMLSDLNSVSSSGVEYYFAGRMEGNTPRWFVGNNNQFIEYKDGHLQIKADVTIGANSDLSASEEFKKLQDDIKGLQNQIDGKVEAFYFDYDPSIDTYPTNEWTTDTIKEEHLNDTFTNTESGQSWRWLLKDGVYQWVEIADTQALQMAQEALNLANSKVTIFTETPKTPYKVKDLWFQGKGGNTKRCIKARTEQETYNADDWVNADDYKDFASSVASDAEQNAKDYANEQISDYDLTIKYLKDAFIQGSVLDVNGVTLSALVGVKDENGSVVAGLYGGGSNTLNNAGYADPTHGAMLLFGGIEGVDKPKIYKTAIFEDGFLQSTYFATAKEGKRVEIFGNELKVYGDDASQSVLSISYDSTGKPRLQYTDKSGNVSWYLSDKGISTSYTVEQIDEFLKRYIRNDISEDINVIHKFVNGIKIGDILLTYDSVNEALCINGNMYALGGITAGGVGSGGSGGGGASYDRLDAWSDYSADKSGWVLSALLGKDLDDRVSALANAGYITASYLSPYALRSEIPSLVGYATQSWVEDKGYLLATTASSTYQPKITSSNKLAYSLISGTPDLSVYFLKSSFTKSNIKATLGISDWALASAKPTYTASEVGALGVNGTAASSLKMTPEYLTDLNNATPWRFFDMKTGYGSTDGNKPNTAWVSGITGTVAGSGNYRWQIADTTGNARPYFRQESNGTWGNWQRLAFLTDLPTKLSQLTDDVVAGKYLPLSGGTVNGSITANSFVGNLTGLADKARDSDKLAGYGLTRFLLMTGRDYTAMDLNTIGDSQSIFTEIRTSEITTTNSPFSGYGALLSLKDRSGFAKMQFAGTLNSSALYFRSEQKGGASITSDWKTIAFTDSNITGNAASATKLQTARTIWGQSFDGTGDIDGDIALKNYSAIKFKASSNANSLNVMMVDSNNRLTIGYDLAGNSLPTRIDGNSVSLRYGTGHVNGLILDSTGNVAIGGATADEKLHVHGNGKFTGALTTPVINTNTLKVGNITLVEENGALKVIGGLIATGGVTSGEKAS